MAGSGSGRGGSGRSSGGTAKPVTARGRVGASVAEVSAADRERNRLGKMTTQYRRRIAELRKQGGGRNAEKIDLLSLMRRKAISRALQTPGTAVDARTRSRARANQRYRTKGHIDFTRYGMSGYRAQSGRYRMIGTTRGQGNLLTGGSSDTVRGRHLKRVG